MARFLLIRAFIIALGWWEFVAAIYFVRDCSSLARAPRLENGKKTILLRRLWKRWMKIYSHKTSKTKQRLFFYFFVFTGLLLYIQLIVKTPEVLQMECGMEIVSATGNRSHLLAWKVSCSLGARLLFVIRGHGLTHFPAAKVGFI